MDIISAVAKFSTTIKMHASIQGGGTICSNPLLEEIKRRRHVALNEHTPCATHTICDVCAASLAIDSSEKSTEFGGIVSFCGSSRLIHGFNDGTVSQDHKWCHQSFLLMSATVVDWGRCKTWSHTSSQCGLLRKCVVMHDWQHLEGHLRRMCWWFPGGCTSGPEDFQVKG